jgi:hypothetical protein
MIVNATPSLPNVASAVVFTTTNDSPNIFPKFCITVHRRTVQYSTVYMFTNLSLPSTGDVCMKQINTTAGKEKYRILTRMNPDEAFCVSTSVTEVASTTTTKKQSYSATAPIKKFHLVAGISDAKILHQRLACQRNISNPTYNVLLNCHD